MDFIDRLFIAKRKSVPPEKTHGYQYLFTVQFFDSYVYTGAGSIRAIKGGLDKVFKIQDRLHRICRQILR